MDINGDGVIDAFLLEGSECTPDDDEDEWPEEDDDWPVDGPSDIPDDDTSYLDPDKFYEYGKWGGGAFDSTAFDELSFEEQNEIIDYLSSVGLYFK